MKIEEQLVAMAVKPQEVQELLKDLNPQEWADTFVWMSQDWLEADKLLDKEFGLPAQHENGRIYPLADRIRDLLGPYASQIRAAYIASTEEEEE